MLASPDDLVFPDLFLSLLLNKYFLWNVYVNLHSNKCNTYWGQWIYKSWYFPVWAQRKSRTIFEKNCACFDHSLLAVGDTQQFLYFVKEIMLSLYPAYINFMLDINNKCVSKKRFWNIKGCFFTWNCCFPFP